MAALPRQFPDLAIHLTDHTRTPIVSSASGHGGDEPEERNGSQTATPTASSAVPPSKPTRQQRAAALDDLAATALRARDAAARLGLGADLPQVVADAGDGPESSSAALLAALGMTPPEHMVVTYSTGAVLIESFLDPRQQRRRQRQEQQFRQLRQAQQTQMASASASPSSQVGQGNNNDNKIAGAGGGGDDADDDDDEEDEAAGCAPLLLGLVAAPDAQSLCDARRATARLERVGRAVQQELASQEWRR
ncbi:hypothetical protein SCUCBS95973_004955 [Sporothrix curviconia]|uniref:Uncharacterized protein n=1 Tax=Sporothrix curviconia TaxID=1260050 RepID=A0ABP0BT46_9PEZI